MQRRHSEISWILQAVIEGRLPTTDMTALPDGGKGIQPASPHTPPAETKPIPQKPADGPSP